MYSKEERGTEINIKMITNCVLMFNQKRNIYTDKRESPQEA